MAGIDAKSLTAIVIKGADAPAKADQLVEEAMSPASYAGTEVTPRETDWMATHIAGELLRYAQNPPPGVGFDYHEGFAFRAAAPARELLDAALKRHGLPASDPNTERSVDEGSDLLGEPFGKLLMGIKGGSAAFANSANDDTFRRIGNETERMSRQLGTTEERRSAIAGYARLGQLVAAIEPYAAGTDAAAKTAKEWLSKAQASRTLLQQTLATAQGYEPRPE